MRHEQTIVYQKCIALMETAQQAIEQFPNGCRLNLVRMLSKFDAGRGHQASETGLRPQAAGSRAQAGGDRLQVARLGDWEP